MPETGDVIASRSGKYLELGQLLGRGGQGQVFAVSRSALAVKLYRPGSAEGETLRRLEAIHALAGRLPSDTFVLPVDLLAPPHTGYVMRRVEKAMPLGDLISPDGSADLLQWYHAKASLRERLSIGIALADAFYQLHLAGWSYRDLSWDNLLLEGDRRVLRAIDCDNLSDGRSASPVMGTPWFIAPEILTSGVAPSQTTDYHSLAVLLYCLLTLRHPLIGDEVAESEPEREDAALKGDLPWVDHPVDRRNASTVGIPPELALLPHVARLFRQAFEEGLHNPQRRVTDGTWRVALREAQDALLTCLSCGRDHYFHPAPRQTCPWCRQEGPTPPALVLKRPDGSFTPIPLGQAGELFLHQLTGKVDGDQVVARYRRAGTALMIEPLADLNWQFRPPVAANVEASYYRLHRLAPLRDGTVIQFGQREGWVMLQPEKSLARPRSQ